MTAGVGAAACILLAGPWRTDRDLPGWQTPQVEAVSAA